MKVVISIGWIKMKKKTMLLIGLLLTALVAFIALRSLTAQNLPGVGTNNQFEYKVTLDGNLTAENFPSRLQDLANSSTVKIEIIDVTDSNVTFNVTYPTLTKTYWINVTDGNSSTDIPFEMFVAANLTVGDSIYNSTEYKDINVTSVETQLYCGAYRKVVMCTYDKNETEGALNYTETLSFTWDQLTGAILEFHLEISAKNTTDTEYYEGTLTMKAISTNVWEKMPEIGVFDKEDWAKYTITKAFFNKTENFTDTVPSYITALNETALVTNTILSVNTTECTVLINQTLEFENGTKQWNILKINVYDGTGNGTFPMWLIGSKLNATDPVHSLIYGMPEITATINETKKEKFLEIDRTVCIVNFTWTGTNGNMNYTQNMTAKWDRATGILLDAWIYHYEKNTTSGDWMEMEISLNLNNTSLWGRHTHEITVGEEVYEVETFSNTSVFYKKVSTAENSCTFEVRGPYGTGFCNFSIPTDFMWDNGTWKIYRGGVLLTEGSGNYTLTLKSDYTYIYIEYPANGALLELKIVAPNMVPELISLVTLTLLISTLLGIAAVKTKIRKKS